MQGPGATLRHTPDLVLVGYHGRGSYLLIEVKTFDAMCPAHASEVLRRSVGTRKTRDDDDGMDAAEAHEQRGAADQLSTTTTAAAASRAPSSSEQAPWQRLSL